MRDITNRSDPETGVDGCVERGGSRPCAGGVILWERALLAWGRKISLGEPASMRAKDEKGAPDASTDAGVLPARCSSPPAVAAGRDGRPELTKSPPNSGAVRAQSADTSRRRLRPAGSSHEPALADGRAAARVEDSLRDPASPLPASDRVHKAVVEPCPPRTGRLSRCAACTTHRSGRTASGRSAARPRRLRRCASAAGAPPRRRVRGRGVPTAQTLPAPPPAAPRRRVSSAPGGTYFACGRAPGSAAMSTSAPSAPAAASTLRVAAVTYLSEVIDLKPQWSAGRQPVTSGSPAQRPKSPKIAASPRRGGARAA